MTGRRAWQLAAVTGLVAVVAGTVASVVAWRQWQATPVYQFREARRLWEARPFRHYRMAANYATNWAQCHYDIEVRDGDIARTFGVTCLSAEAAPTLPVDGIFEVFERYAEGRVCAATGCYCDGTYVLLATYDERWGFPTRITTRFARNWLDDLLHGQFNKQTCLRADLLVERIEIVAVEPLH